LYERFIKANFSSGDYVKNFWVSFISQIEKKTTSKVFKTWFEPLQLISFSPEKICVAVPKQFFADWLYENYKDLIIDTIYNITTLKPKLKFEICEHIYKSELKNYKKDKTILEKKKPFIPENINSNYTFSNFVVGANNQFAHAACQAVSNNPGKTYNPLFVYGGVGLGKTHLLHAIVHQCIKNKHNTNVCYLSSEKFTNELINSIRYDRMSFFRKKYRNIDVLLLDDIQFIAGKERTQEEFFHTFNSLFEIKKQIVVTSDKTPKEINNLEERLRSRFEWGLIADIQIPETETKVAILKKKALENKVFLPNEVAFLLAESIESNIRELEGLLTRLSAYASLSGCEIDLAFTKEVLKNFIKIDEKETPPEEIQKVVSKNFNIKLSDLKGKKKSKSIVLPRQISMYLMRKKTKLSFPEIGQLFGGKDHSTVIYSIKKIESFLREDKKIKETVENLLKKI
jgi:chromosomal replication initiator protein